MTLHELCEPIFQYMCRLNRSARKGAAPEQSQVRNEINMLLSDCRNGTAGDMNLARQFEEIELVLIFFIDFMIKDSTLPFHAEWKELAYERQELAGDEKFFDMLEETLADSSEAASERLVIFYTCMGLGFTGWYADNREYLRKKMMEISARIKKYAGGDVTERLCPNAYEHVNTSNLIEPPGASLMGIGIVLVCLIAVLFVLNIYLYKSGSAKLVEALNDINNSSTSTTQVEEGR